MARGWGTVDVGVGQAAAWQLMKPCHGATRGGSARGMVAKGSKGPKAAPEAPRAPGCCYLSVK